MSEVQTEQSEKHLGRVGSYALLAGTVVAAFYTAIPIIATVASHLLLTAIAGGAAAGVAIAKPENKYVKMAKSLFSTIGKAYKDAFKQAGNDWTSLTNRAIERENARKAASEASEPASSLGSKTAAADFSAAANGNDAKVTVTPAAAPAAPKPTANSL